MALSIKSVGTYLKAINRAGTSAQVKAYKNAVITTARDPEGFVNIVDFLPSSRMMSEKGIKSVKICSFNNGDKDVKTWLFETIGGLLHHYDNPKDVHKFLSNIYY